MCQKKRKLKNKYFGKNQICNKRHFISILIYFMITTPIVYFLIIFLKSNFNLSNVLSIYLFFVIVFALGTFLACSRSALCFFSLLLPQLCSRRGRTVMVAYVFVLTLKYPTKNLLNNIEVLTDSISCGQVTVNLIFKYY